MEAAVTERVGAGEAGSICVPSRTDPPRSPHAADPTRPSLSARGSCIRGDPCTTFGGWARRASEPGVGCPPRAPTLC